MGVEIVVTTRLPTTIAMIARSQHGLGADALPPLSAVVVIKLCLCFHISDHGSVVGLRCNCNVVIQKLPVRAVSSSPKD